MVELVRAENLKQGYGRRTVISGLNIEIEPGVTALLGPNGSGKTTLLNTLATVLKPQAGQIWIFGEEIRTEAHARKARADIGVLPQGFSFSPRFTVAEFLTYVAWTKQLPDRLVRERVAEVIELLEIGRYAHQRLGAVSGGVLQRAGIAQALVNKPRLLILDEPTVGLDPVQRLSFRRLLDEGAAECVLYSTHIIDDISLVAARTVVISDGRIRFDGSNDELASHASGELPAASLLESGYVAVLGDSKDVT